MSESTSTSTRTADAAGPAWSSRRAWVMLALVAALGVAVDLGSKWLAFRFIADQPVVVSREAVLAAERTHGHLGGVLPAVRPVTVVPRVLEFTLVLNRGAVFGLGQGGRWFFVLFTLGALGLALWMFAHWTRAQDRAAHAALGLLIAGGLGNLYDRIVYACVRDFIHPLPGVRLPFGWRMPHGEREIWPYVSNVADLWLLVGIGILMWHLWRQGRSEPARRERAAG